VNDFVDLVRRDPFSLHGRAQFQAYFLHPFFGTMKTERPPQFLGFITGKIGHDHRDLEHLFLKQGDPEGAA
jgi:hypothetical protein